MSLNINHYHKQKLNISLLQNSKVLVVGAGGVGSPLITYLSRSGLGRLDIADGDDVSFSNLYRQIYFSESDVGLNKAFVTKNAILKTVQNIKVDNHGFLKSIDDYLKLGKYDLVIDCSDNFKTMMLSNQFAINTKTKFIAGSCEGEDGQIFYFDYSSDETLNQHGCLKCLLGDFKQEKEVLYVLGPSAGIVGCFMAKEALKILGNQDYKKQSSIVLINERGINSYIPTADEKCNHNVNL
jgi:molybdopterin/thiamine biosynthesis adenylyltransferase